MEIYLFLVAVYLSYPYIDVSMPSCMVIITMCYEHAQYSWNTLNQSINQPFFAQIKQNWRGIKFKMRKEIEIKGP